MPSLNLDLNFWEHPKIVRLISRHGEHGVACLQRLWIFVGRFHCESGCLTGYDELEIESAVKWTGKPTDLVNALTDLGLLDKSPKGYRVHDWNDHAGHIALYRHRAKLAASIRHGKTQAKRKRGLDDVKPQSVSRDASSNAKDGFSSASALHCTALHCTAPDPEGDARGRDNVSSLALEAHRAFGSPPSYPAATLVANTAELIAMKYTPNQIRKVCSWVAKERPKYGPQNAATLTDPAKFGGWYAKANGNGPPPRQLDESWKEKIKA